MEIGQKVECIKTKNDISAEIGDVGIIIAMDDGDYLVEFKKDIDGHDGGIPDTKRKYPHLHKNCWWYFSYEIDEYFVKHSDYSVDII